MKFRDYYAVLGVARDASADEIKRAWRKLARKYHPDVSKEADAQRRMQEVNEAYEVLGDAEKRAAYDRLGSDYRAGQDFTPPPDWERAFGHGFGRGGAGDGPAPEDLGELFETLFGRSAGARRRPARGHDEHARIEIDLDDSLHGATRELRLQLAEPADDGRLRLRDHVLQVNIPRGVRPGQQLRLAGQGAAGASGARGDLYLEVGFRPHRLYRVDGADLYLTLPLAPWEAALGAGVRVPTPEGPVDLQVPPGTSTGRKLRLKGRGIPSRPPGDLYAVAEVVLPPAATDQAREAYRAMARDLAFDPRAGWPG